MRIFRVKWQKKYGQTMKAITEMSYICKNRNILKEYLESKDEKTADIMMTLFDDKQKKCNGFIRIPGVILCGAKKMLKKC